MPGPDHQGDDDRLMPLMLVAVAWLPLAIVLGLGLGLGGRDIRLIPSARTGPAPLLVPLRLRLLPEDDAHAGQGAVDIRDEAIAAPAPLPSTPTQPSPDHDAAGNDGMRPALPVTAPDLGLLDGLRLPSGRVWLRLHIDATGVVQRVEILEVEPQDQPFATRLAAIWQVTRHVPARRGGVDVASVKDIRVEPTSLR